MSQEHDAWEDMVSADSSVSSRDHRQSSEPPSPRKRANRKVVPIQSSPFTKAVREPKPVPRNRKPTVLEPKPQIRWNEAILSAFTYIIIYLFDVFRVALIWLRKPLSLILVGYLLAWLVSHLHYTFSSILNSALAPMCLLPAVSHLAICRSAHTGDLAPTGSQYAARQADYPRLINIQSTTFEQLLDDSVGGAGLALEIKKAEMATSDLKTLVRMSSLTSRERMVQTLDTFVEEARRTARGLQRFSAKVGGAVDGIIAVNDYALIRIEAAASAGLFLNIWRSITAPIFIGSPTSAVLTTSFTQAMTVLESELHTLIMAAEGSLHDLESLEEQLRLLHAIVSREDDSLSTSKQELLTKIWTVVGGNRAELRRYDSHLKLLGGLADYRQRALAHVVGALQTLQTMSAELEALRERVSQPVLLGDTIPLEVHVRSIRGGLERLTEGRLKAKEIEEARYAKLLAPLDK